MRQRHRNILFLSIALSLITHITVAAFIQRHSLWFSPINFQTAGIQAPYLSLIEKKKRDEILKEAFTDPHTSTEKSAPIPQQEPVDSTYFHTSLSKAEEDSRELSILFQQNLPFPTEELLSFHFLPTFTFPIEERLNLFDHLSKELILPIPANSILSHLSPAPLPSFPSALKSQTVPVKEAPASEITYSEPLLDSHSVKESTDLSKAALPIPPSNLPLLPTLADLDTATYSDAFEADLVFLPKEGEEGYIFALTLIPRIDFDLPKLKQHFTFLIDRSNSIQKDRLNIVKNSVHKALEELMPDDTFNIVVFDSKMEKLSPRSLPASPEALVMAEDFLNKISLGSFFSQANLYRPLFLTVPGDFKSDEVHTAILLTDSEGLGKKTEQKALLSDWTRYNEGKVSLYAISIKGDRHLGTLDTATAFNRGKLSYSPTKRGIKRKLLKLMKTIQSPVAKNLACHAISRSSRAKIELYPHSTTTSHLFLDQPYVILGSTNSLDDFILFVQGRTKNQWLNIKKTISFLNAKKGNQSLRAEWALQRSYKLYEQYIYDDRLEHLTEARALLKPYDFQVAFE